MEELIWFFFTPHIKNNQMGEQQKSGQMSANHMHDSVHV